MLFVWDAAIVIFIESTSEISKSYGLFRGLSIPCHEGVLMLVKSSCLRSGSFRMTLLIIQLFGNLILKVAMHYWTGTIFDAYLIIE